MDVKTRNFEPIGWGAFVRRARGQMVAIRAILAEGTWRIT
jgi:hypothetical protein